MATLKQIEANRKNAQRSTGPATAAAKAAVRFNALKSGIDAASIIIPGEDPEKLKTLAAEFAESWRPADPREREMVDQLLDDAWRLRRLRAAETQIWTRSIEARRTCQSHRPHTEFGDAFDGYSDTLSRLQRLVTSIKRSYHQTSVDLERLQAARLQAATTALLEPEPPPVEPLTASPQTKTEVAEQSQLDASSVPPSRPQSPAFPRPSSDFPIPPSSGDMEITPNHENLTGSLCR